MRKTIIKTFLIISFIVIFTLACSASEGDIAGFIYSTDILAKVNGEAIRSYNIGGRTVIIAEDLFEKFYGFNGKYDDGKRLLEIVSKGVKPYVPDEIVERDKTGRILGNIYETDIKVIFNGSEVKGYNLDGKTAICIEDLGEIDDSPNSNFGYSKYLANYKWDDDTRTIELNTPITNINSIMTEKFPNFRYYSVNNHLRAQYEPLNDYYSWFGSLNYTDGFEKEPFIIKPLYLEIADQTVESGYCYVSYFNDEYYTEFILYDPEKTKELLRNIIPPKLEYDEVLSYLCDDLGYKILDRKDNEKYTLLALTKDDEKINKIVAACKTGGYALLMDCSSYYDREININLNDNIAQISVYPFGGPHGITTMVPEIDLDSILFL